MQFEKDALWTHNLQHFCLLLLLQTPQHHCIACIMKYFDFCSRAEIALCSISLQRQQKNR
jgi:hypothetical protein